VVIRARTGAGSGEVELFWDAVPGATGYRVLREDADRGQLEVLAEFDVTTGQTTAVSEVILLKSAEQYYIPPGVPFAWPDRSTAFQSVEYPCDGERCYRVVAFNADGAGPASVLACGTPP
jgi:hypothetical protein